MFAFSAFGAQEGAGVAGRAVVEQAVVGVDGGPVGHAAVAGVAGGGGGGNVVAGLAGLGQGGAVATRTRRRGLNQTVIKRKRRLPRRRENLVARIAIICGIQSGVMFTGFAAGGNAVTAGAIFHEPSVIYCRATERCSAFVAHTAIRRSNHVTNVLTFCLKPIMTKCTSTQRLRVKSGQVGSDIWLFPICKAAPSRTGVANLANAGR